MISSDDREDDDDNDGGDDNGDGKDDDDDNSDDACIHTLDECIVVAYPSILSSSHSTIYLSIYLSI